MIEPWFTAEVASRFASLSLLSLFALVEIPAKRGHHRVFVIGVWNTVIVLSGFLVAIAAVGWLLGQPGYVVRTLGGSGCLIGILFLVLKKSVLALYRQAELRKTIAEDL